MAIKKSEERERSKVCTIQSNERKFALRTKVEKIPEKIKRTPRCETEGLSSNIIEMLSGRARKQVIRIKAKHYT
jgi:hypothetical protein